MTSAITVPQKKKFTPRSIAWAALVLAALSLSGCVDDKKASTQAQEQNAELARQNTMLMKQLQDAKTTMDQQQQQLTALQTELEKMKAAQAAAAAARPTAPANGAARPASNGHAAASAPPPAPTGPAPKNLPYSLYTGILTTRKGETVTLGSVNFGKIDRVPLSVNGGDVEVGMDKIRYIRRLGQYDATKKQFPVSVELIDGQEVRAGLPFEHVKGVDPRFGSAVEIPIASLIELQFVQPQ